MMTRKILHKMNKDSSQYMYDGAKSNHATKNDVGEDD